ncbi:uncharacterized protein LOC119604008 [Lucilia sericata]|uniref:uncharacterized protein LOC119604008 n=1 Tax=Lucilia sericata TaxID=13632 RepID=UPI0018A84ACC|nr:uncharacterized protein LOC119604008 [Lucilia sericata]
MLDGVRKNVLENLIAQETRFGWILIGPLSNSTQGAFTTSVSFYTDVRLDKQIEKFWTLEEPPQHSPFTPEDEYCEEHYKNTVKRTSEGRYMVSLPFKPQYSTDNCLDNSREKAKKLFLRNEASLARKPDLKLIYDNVLTEYEVLNHMCQVKYEESEALKTFYLPHHAVFKPESSATKVRVVFNASCRSTNGLSLNDLLYSGPILQNDIMLLVIRWRFYRYVFNGDIEKMYRQILIDPQQSRFHRIVFRENEHDDLKDF